MLALLVAVLGLATLGEYALGWRPEIDELLIRDTAKAFNSIPGRMSPYSAVVFATIGLGLAALPIQPWFSWLAANLAILIGGVSFVGYLWRANELVTDRILPPVAINTAAIFILLGVGTLLAGDRRHRQKWGRLAELSAVEIKMAVGFAGIFALLSLTGGHAYKAAAAAAEAHSWVIHTVKGRHSLGELYGSISDAESQQRNYLLTGKAEYLEESKRHSAEADQQVGALAELVANNPPQVQKLRALQVLVAQGEGRQLMTAIRDAIRQIDSVEAELLKTRSDDSTNKQFVTLLSLLATLAVAGFMALFGVIRRDLTRRTLSEAALRRSEENLTITLDSIGDAVLATDAGGRVIRLNPIAEKLTGWPPCRPTVRIGKQTNRR